MYHRFAQKRWIWGFSGGIGSVFLLDYQAKAGWLVGIAQCDFLVASLRMHAGVTSVALTPHRAH